jgi:hypothetical protein
MELIFLLCAIGGVWWVCRGDGNGNQPGNQTGKKTAFYRHVDGRLFQYIGLMQNQSETLYIIENGTKKQVVDALFFQNCFAISEQEYFAISDFDRNRPKRSAAERQSYPGNNQGYPQRQQPAYQQQSPEQPAAYPYRPEPAYRQEPRPAAYRPEPESYQR